MIDSYYRELYQRVCVNPLLPLLQRFSPILLTVTGCLLGLATCPLLAFDLPLLALSALILSGFLDTLDGSLARYQKNTSPKGAVLDIVCDRAVEFSVILGLFFVDANSRGLPCILMLGSILMCITSFLVVGIFTENQSAKGFHYSPGLIERAEAFLFFAIMIAFPGIFFIGAYLFSGLTLLTAVIRLRQFTQSPI